MIGRTSLRNMKESLPPYNRILIVSKPLVPPWNDSTKNLPRILVDNIDQYVFHVFANRDFNYPRKNVISEAIYNVKTGYELSRIQKIRIFLRLLKPDPQISAYHLFFAPYPMALLFLRLIAKVKRKKIIFSVCSLPKSESTIRKLEFADKLTTLSIYTKKLLGKHGIAASCIPPSVDTALLPQFRDRQIIKNEFGFMNEKIVLYGGDYETLENDTYMISAIEKTVSNIHNLKFVFACRIKTPFSKEREGSLKEKVYSKGLSKHVVFLNEVEEIHKLIASSDLSIFPVVSTYRKMDIPLFLIECLAYGLPIVISDIPPLNEIYQTEIGSKINPENPESLSSAIVNILNDDESYKELSQNAKLLCCERFDAKVMANRYKEIYDQALGIENIENYYDQFSIYYDKKRDNPYHKFIDEETIDIASKYIYGNDVLEVGCGTGRLLEKMKDKSVKSVGMDLSFGMLGISSRKGLLVTQGSSTALPFRMNTFGVVASFKVLPHVPEIKKTIEEMAKVVKKEGYLLLEFYNPYSLRGIIKSLKPKTKISNKLTDADVYVRYDSIKTINTYLPENLKIIEIRGTRIVLLSAYFMRIPLISPLLKLIDKFLSRTIIRYVAGFIIVIAQKTS